MDLDVLEFFELFLKDIFISNFIRVRQLFLQSSKSEQWNHKNIYDGRPLALLDHDENWSFLWKLLFLMDSVWSSKRKWIISNFKPQMLVSINVCSILQILHMLHQIVRYICNQIHICTPHFKNACLPHRSNKWDTESILFSNNGLALWRLKQ